MQVSAPYNVSSIKPTANPATFFCTEPMHFCPSPTVQSFQFILLSPVCQCFIPPSPLMYMKIRPLLHGILLPKAYPPDLHLVLLFPIVLSNAEDLHLVLLFPVALSNAV